MPGDNQQAILGMKPQTLALLTAGVVAAAGLGYVVYFDQKRRSDPTFRKQLKRERKKMTKAAKSAEETEKAAKVQLIETILDKVSKDTFPETPEKKEEYFMTQVAAGEALCGKGEQFYDEAVLPFYRAMKVYPAPMELIMVYQKTIPEYVFQMVVNIMALEQHKRQQGFYEQFPPKETKVKLGELPAGTTDEGKPIVRRGLVADVALTEGQHVYSEGPLVSALHPALEGSYCNHCLRKVTEENKVACANCSEVAFCSGECETAASDAYHKYLCSKNKAGADEEGNKELAFLQFSKDKNLKYPYMVSKFLSTMVAEEVERTKSGVSADKSYNSWDHVDRFRYLDTAPTEATTQEIQTLKELLGEKVQGISEFLTNEIYLMLKGKLLYNAYAVNTESAELELEESSEHVRKTPTDKHSVGAALYKISTYLGQADSEEEANVRVVFDKENHDVSVYMTKDVKEGDELKAVYTLPVPKASQQ
ncbi:MAS20 protein import receptor-domain-containing protein [Syncephalastrum racemosum]|uniref:MAS20 protein import receptor-domain-containing protein n=1 Tax=Syncephalastrum racemosum TaxID=13706 RepID=A0A1X2HH75_SYNRA|nr:MAS20 protein import receptor-domain-containing protein [Syncephalastrum racemosum]